LTVTGVVQRRAARPGGQAPGSRWHPLRTQPACGRDRAPSAETPGALAPGLGGRGRPAARAERRGPREEPDPRTESPLPTSSSELTSTAGVTDGTAPSSWSAAPARAGQAALHVMTPGP
jgi:hypothetical protein